MPELTPGLLSWILGSAEVETLSADTLFMASAALTTGAQQGVGIALGLQSTFSWNEELSSVLSAGVMAGLGRKLRCRR